MTNIRVRFAPSPTGALHIGSLRTALYNYLFARHNGGQFLLRIEDTDRTRFVEGSTDALVRTLDTMGLQNDEGVFLENDKISQHGEYGPYIQSERLAIYKELVDKLLDDGFTYKCFCTHDRLESLRQNQRDAKTTPKYDRLCLNLSAEDLNKNTNAGVPFVVRLKVPEGKTTFKDIIRGEITIENSEVDDQVLWKSDGFPTYHLASTVDDHLMEITHVIRAEEWITSTPKHIMLYNCFKWAIPQFAHLPLILNPDRSKLSKRQGDVAVDDYLKKGYLPETIINFVATLGFNPKSDQEIYSIDELIDLFNLEKVNVSGAVFSHEKLDWINGMYIRKKTDSELAILAMPYLQSAGKSVPAETLTKIIAIEKERIKRMDEIVERIDTYLNIPHYEKTLLVWKKADEKDAAHNLTKLSAFLSGLPEGVFETLQGLEAQIREHISHEQAGIGNVLWPMRAALSGRAESPSPFEFAWVLGKNETLQRINNAITMLNKV